MPDDRPDPSAVAGSAEWDEQPYMSPEEKDAWLAENQEWVRAKVKEALDDPTPALTSEQVRKRMLETHAELLKTYGR